MKLTKTLIDKAHYTKNGSAREFIWDSDLSGFGIRIYPSNKKTFVLSYRIRGRKHLISIGQYGAFTLEQARGEARTLIIKLASGHDPLDRRKHEKIDRSLRQLCSDFLEKHSKVYKKSWREDQRRITTYINTSIGQLQVGSITRADIASLHQRVGKNSIYEANKILALLGTIYKFGNDWGFCEANSISPTKGIKRFKELSRDRWVTPEEMPRLAAAIDMEQNLFIRSAIWLYLITGLRKTELLEAKWKNLDWTRKELRIDETKNGTSHHIPLSEAALAIIRNIPRLENNPFIIAGRKQGKGLINISKPWGRIKDRAGVADVRLHDLRRTTGSWLAQRGNSLHLIARVLNHRSSDTTKIYARFGQDNVREALEAHGKEMSEFITKTNQPLIVDFKKCSSDE